MDDMKKAPRRRVFAPLLYVQLTGMFNSRSSGGKKKRPGGKLLAGILIFSGLIMCGYVALAAYGYASMGLTELIPPLMMTAASIVTFFAAFLKSGGLLFGYGDFDTLMSLPLSVSDVVLSRFAALYLFELPFAAGVTAPSCAVYCAFTRPAPQFYLYFIVSLFLIPLIPLVFAVLFSVVITYISSRIPHKNAVTIILSLAAVSAVLALSFMPSFISESEAASVGAMLGRRIAMIYPFAALYAGFTVGLNVWAFVIFSAVSVGLTAALIWLFSPLYPKLCSLLAAKSTHRGYKKEAVRVSSPFGALYMRDMKRYWASPIYVTNTFFAVIMMLGGAAALLIINLGPYPQYLPIFAPYASYIICAIAGTCCITASSLSLEGKSMWILSSLPVAPDDVYLSKIMLNLIFTVPSSLVASSVVLLKLPLGIADAVLLFLAPLAFCVFAAVAGLAVNMRFLNLDWTSEMVVVQQSLPSVIAVLGGMLIPGLPALALLAFGAEYSAITGALFSAACAAGAALIYNKIKEAPVRA